MIDMKSIRFPPPAADEMIRAILADRKTVTRRPVRPHYRGDEVGFQIITNLHTGAYVRIEYYDEWENETRIMTEPYCPGDVLYVRETWQYAYNLDGNEQPIEGTGRYLYAADDLPEPFGFWVNPDGTHRDSMPWRPSIHMPREAARIFMRVTDVRVERVQDIAYADIIREGITEEDIDEREAINREASSKDLYSRLWNSTVKPDDLSLYGWDANPWVWVIEFERITKEDTET